MLRMLRLCSASLLLLALAGTALASTGNPTPIFILAWGTAGAAPAQFSNPVGIVTDPLGNVYVADQSNNRIQKFDRNGNLIVQWGSSGSGPGQFSLPAGIALDANGFVYVVDEFNNRVQKFTSLGSFMQQWGTSGTGNSQFAFPYGIAIDPVGYVYVVDQNNNRIQKFDTGGGYLTQWGTAGSGNGQFNSPLGVAVDPTGNVYVADYINRRVQKFTGAGVYVTQWGTNGTGNGQFTSPTGLASDAVGSIYVVDSGGNRVEKFSGTGTYLAKWGTLGAANNQFNAPNGIGIDAAGAIYVSDQGNSRVQKFSGSTQVAAEGTLRSILTWGSSGTGNGQFSSIQGMATDGGGNVYTVEGAGNRVQLFSGTGGYITQWGSTGSGNGQFSGPDGIAVDPLYVYVAEYNNNRIQKFTSGGTYILQWGATGSGNGQFINPGGIATDGTALYVADRGNNRIQKFTSAGVFLAQGGKNQFNLMSALAVDPIGSVFAADAGNNKVQKFTTAPAIALTSDVRNDQGRSVRLRILHASADTPGSGLPVLRYDVYRRIDTLPGGLVAGAANGGARGAGIALAGWDQVGSITARGDAEYNVVVPTLVDATSASLEFSAYFVSAITSDPYTYYDSAVDNGFSVDNLPPPAPGPFLAAYAGGATHLHWSPSSASDFLTFRLYRGADASFVPGAGNLVNATADTGAVDVGAAGGTYKLSAVDWNGNESPSALLSPSQTTGVAPAPALEFTLQGVRPNPALGDRVSVEFTLPSAAPATLELIDVAGRRVVTRSVGALGAGRHALDLNGARLASGLYLVRLTQGARTSVVRATVIR